MWLLLLIGLLSFSYQKDTTDYFIEFQTMYSKTYSSPEEFQYRLSIFEKNLELFDYHSKSDKLATYGINQFADLTPEEFKENYLKLYGERERINKNKDQSFLETNLLLNIEWDQAIKEKKFDWRDNIKGDRIEAQGSCWSCWAFVAVTNIEYQYFFKFGEMIRLSEQQLVDCDTLNFGCKGGLMTKTYEYIKQNGLMLVRILFLYFL